MSKKPKSVTVKNPSLLYLDASAFRFKVEFSDEFHNSLRDLEELRKFDKVVFSHETTDMKGNETWCVMSTDRKAMLDLYTRIPKIADKHGVVLRNIAPSQYRKH